MAVEFAIGDKVKGTSNESYIITPASKAATVIGIDEDIIWIKLGDNQRHIVRADRIAKVEEHESWPLGTTLLWKGSSELSTATWTKIGEDSFVYIFLYKGKQSVGVRINTFEKVVENSVPKGYEVFLPKDS